MILEISCKRALFVSLHVRESGIDRGNILILESGILGLGIRNTAQGIRNRTDRGIQNPSFTDKDWNLEIAR